jgi:peptidoglycan/LPS O-acetylase OafA/YrhL
LAILLVVAYHIDLPGVSAGFIGVDVFFVISGYLITRNLLTESDTTGRVALLSFWGRRIRRLVPAMASMVAVTLVAALFILPVIMVDDVVRQGSAAALYVSNILFANELGDYFAGEIRNSPFLHTWSLGVEEQFYVVWPLVVGIVVAAFRRRPGSLRLGLGVVFGLMFVVSFAISLRLTDERDPWAFYGLGSRAWEFAVAGLLALVTVPRAFERGAVRNIASIVGLLVIVGTAVTLSGTTPYPGAWAVLPVGGTILLILAGSPVRRPAVPVVGALATPAAQWLGRMSYSWYLWHWPFIILMVAQLGDEAGVKLGAAFLSLLVAVASYRYLETPVRFQPRLVRSIGWTMAVGAGLTTGALLVGVGVKSDADRLFTTGLDEMLATASAEAGLETCAAEPVSPGGVEYCLAGDVESDEVVMFIGDSHAQHWSTTLDEVAASEGIRVVGRWRGSCPALDVKLAPTQAGAAAMEECYRFREDTWRLMDEIRPDAVVFSNANLYEFRVLDADGNELPLAERAPLWRDRYRDMLQRPLEEGIGVAVVRDNPHIPFDPVACIAEAREIAPCNPSREETLGPTASIREAEGSVLDELGIPTMTTIDDICDEDECVVATDRYLRFADGAHLSTAFTATQEPELRQLLRSALAGQER